MPVEIAVRPPLLSINHGATFMVTDLGGEIQADTEQGVFADDTRFVTYYAIFANGLPWQRLNSAATAYYAARIYLTNAVVPTEDGDVPAGTLSLVIHRTVADGIHEDLHREPRARPRALQPRDRAPLRLRRPVRGEARTPRAPGPDRDPVARAARGAGDVVHQSGLPPESRLPAAERELFPRLCERPGHVRGRAASRGDMA